jgi:hypothetical protein
MSGAHLALDVFAIQAPAAHCPITTRSASGTITNHSHHAKRRVCQLFSSQ